MISHDIIAVGAAIIVSGIIAAIVIIAVLGDIRSALLDIRDELHIMNGYTSRKERAAMEESLSRQARAKEIAQRKAMREAAADRKEARRILIGDEDDVE